MKNELEICVKCLNTKEEVIDKLQNQGFKIKEDFILKDIYYVKKDKVISLDNSNELLSNYVLIRQTLPKNVVCFKLKEKKFDELGNILNQSSCSCEVKDKQKAIIFIENLGYKELLKINDHNILMSNGKNEIYIQDVENLGVYLEMEQKNIYSTNDNGKDIKEIINNLSSYNLNIDKNNYFVKKAYDMLERKVTKKWFFLIFF